MKHETFTTNPITGQTFYHGANIVTKEEFKMKATVKNLNEMHAGDIICTAWDENDAYTKLPDGGFKSHLYCGEIYDAETLALQMGDIECKVITKEENDMTFTIGNTQYTINELGNRFFKIESGKKTRISRAEYESALNEHKLDEAAENPKISVEEFAEMVQKTGESTTSEEVKEIQKKMKKKRRPKDIAYEYKKDGESVVTLTAKQVDFIKHMPDSDFFDNGLDSTPWCDCFCDEIGGQFAGKPMTVGAMFSTLREKGIIYIETSRVNGKKAKYFGFTELGKTVVRGWGLE